jgi:hypothetical protein
MSAHAGIPAQLSEQLYTPLRDLSDTSTDKSLHDKAIDKLSAWFKWLELQMRLSRREQGESKCLG